MTVTADSPIVQMFSMWVANPAMLPKDSELIKYGAHSAVLKTEAGGKTLRLQILLSGKDVTEVVLNGRDEELLFAMFDQAAVDRLAEALSR